MRIGYKRVSTTDQNTDRQLADVQVEKVYEDKVSGKNTDRPALKELMAYIREGDVLVVHSMDRLARNLADLLNMVKDLTDRGVSVEFVKENLTFDSKDDSPMAKLMLSMIGAFSEFERNMILARQREGIIAARAKGIHLGRKQEVTDEQIAKIGEMVKLGIPKARIAKDLNISRGTLYKYLRPAMASSLWGKADGKSPDNRQGKLEKILM